MLRFTAAEAVTKSTPSKSTVPPEIRQPSRVNPMAARPTVDFPAPDSPINPRTSPFFRSRSIPFTIGFQTSSDLPSIFNPRILRSCCVMTLILQARRFVQHPIHHEIHRHREQSNCSSRQEGCGGDIWRKSSKIYELRQIFDHCSPIREGRLNAHTQEGQ